MKNYKKMKSLCLIFLLMTRDVTVLAYEHTFIRLYRVVPEESSVHILNTNIGVPNHLFCANLCQNEECLSFLYDEVDKRCETYTRLIGSGTDEDVNTTAMYFYKHSALSSCSDIPPRYPSGVYQGVTAEDKMYTFFCYFDLTGVQWIVIQRRLSGVVDFHRTWNEYKNGFGDLYGNFWIGNDFLHLVTNTSRILRIEVEFLDGTEGYAQYANFQVANEDQKYKLVLNGFTGNLSDSLLAEGAYFSTRDVDNDENPHGSCSNDYFGGWWYKWCSLCNLNGLYHDGQNNGLSWNFVRLKKTLMMIK